MVALLRCLKHFLISFSHYRQQIDTLRNQNKAYDDAKTFADDIKAAKQALKDAEDTILRNIESMINSQMTRYNDFVYNQTRKAPEINLLTAHGMNSLLQMTQEQVHHIKALLCSI